MFFLNSNKKFLLIQIVSYDTKIHSRLLRLIQILNLKNKSIKAIGIFYAQAKYLWTLSTSINKKITQVCFFSFLNKFYWLFFVLTHKK
jgi:hypothetical protein